MRTIDILRARRLVDRAPALLNVGDPIDLATYTFVRDAKEVLVRITAQAEVESDVISGRESDEPSPSPLPDQNPTKRQRRKLRAGDIVRFRKPRLGHPADSRPPGCRCCICDPHRVIRVLSWSEKHPRCVYVLRDGNGRSSRELFHRSFFELAA